MAHRLQVPKGTCHSDRTPESVAPGVRKHRPHAPHLVFGTSGDWVSLIRQFDPSPLNSSASQVPCPHTNNTSSSRCCSSAHPSTPGLPPVHPSHSSSLPIPPPDHLSRGLQVWPPRPKTPKSPPERTSRSPSFHPLHVLWDPNLLAIEKESRRSCWYCQSPGGKPSMSQVFPCRTTTSCIHNLSRHSVCLLASRHSIKSSTACTALRYRPGLLTIASALCSDEMTRHLNCQ